MSLFQKPKAEPERPPATPTIAPESPPPDSKDIEKRLFDAMDNAALKLLENLVDAKITEKESREAFKMAMDWLAKSRRLRPKSDDDLPMGVEGMREYIAGLVDDELRGRGGTRGAKTERARRAAKSISRRTNGAAEGSALAKAMKQ